MYSIALFININGSFLDKCLCGPAELDTYDPFQHLVLPLSERIVGDGPRDVPYRGRDKIQ